MFTKTIPFALLVSAPLLSSASPFNWTPTTVTFIRCRQRVSVPSNPPPTNIGGGVAGITPQLENLLSDLRQLDSLLTSVSSAVAKLLSTVTDIVKHIRTLYQLTGLVDQCKANTAKLATLKAALIDLVGTLSILYPRLSSECDTPAHADALTAAYQNLLHTLNN
ncbi:hypothetical protein B0H14DRAFT_3454505 [Mycena olivaceomarginata]|nr:hypothetical protein B0H14DRAFT_3454505 [Mycena olivaceomarginata]